MLSRQSCARSLAFGLLLASVVGAAATMERLPDWSVVYEEDFGEDWDSTWVADRLERDSWEHVLDGSRGLLRVTSGCWLSVSEGGQWSDYSFSTRIRLEGGKATIAFRSSRAGRYFVGIEWGRLVLAREKPWGPRVVIADARVFILHGQWYDIAIVGEGSTLAVFVNGELRIRYVDTVDPIYFGDVAYEFYGDRPSFSIDRIEIRVSGRAVPEALRDPQAVLEIAEGYLSAGQLDRAEEAYARAAELFGELGDSSRQAEALRAAGTALAMHGHASQALAYLSRALAYYDRVEHMQGRAYCLLGIGESLLAQGEQAEAEERLTEAHELFVQLGDRVGEMETLEKLARIHEAREEWEQSVANLSRVLDIASELGDRWREASVRLWVAQHLMALRRFRQAEAMFREAQAVYRGLADLDGEIKSLRALAQCLAQSGDLRRAVAVQQEAIGRAEEENRQVLRADLLLQLGSMHLRAAPSQEAVDAMEAALQIYREESHLDGMAWSHQALGSLYIQLGLPAIALGHFESGLEIATAARSARPQAAHLVGTGLSSMGMSELNASLEAFARAEEIYLTIPGEAISAGWCRLLKSRVHLDQGELSRAAIDAADALDLFRSHGNREKIMEALVVLSDVEERRGQLRGARAYLEEAMAIAYSEGRSDIGLGYEGRLANVCRALRDLPAAKAHYENAIERAESVLQGLRYEPHIRSYLQSHIAWIYLSYLELLLELGRSADALLVAEQMRSRTLHGGTSVDEGEDGAVGGPWARIIDANAVRGDVEHVVGNLPPRTAALEYLVREDRVFVWVIRDGRVLYPHTIHTSRSRLQEMIIRFRELIEGEAGGLQQLPSEEFYSLSSELYGILIRPLEDWLGGIDHLIIVPSGSLYYLPFAALMDCQGCSGRAFLGGKYLIERYSLSMTPSLAALRYASEPRSAGGAGLLALADPDSGNPLMARLPEAAEEALAIREILGQGEVYVAEEATELVLRQHAQEAAHLLISAHGIFNPSNPMASYLQLAPSPGTDGRLHTYEVFELPLVAELVTLSACETLLPSLVQARGEVRAAQGIPPTATVVLEPQRLDELTSGDEIVGLTRAFIYAGARSVLSTLWSVASGPTRDLMIQFYTYLSMGETRAEALRKAQSDVRDLHLHPRYWAAFVLVGEWR